MRKTERFLIFGSWLFAALISLAFAPLLRHRIEAERIPNGLTAEYREYTVGAYREKIDGNGCDYAGLVMKLKETGKPFILMRVKASNCLSCAAFGRELQLELVRGRQFTEQDMMSGANVALVSEKAAKRIFEAGGTERITIGDDEFEVIGVYRADGNQVNVQPDYVVSGLSENEMMRSSYIDGVYQMEIDGVSEVTASLNEWCGLVERKTPYQKNDREKWEDAFSVTVFSRNFLAVTGVFCAIAFLVVVLLWKRNLRREIRVRRLCGGTGGRLAGWMSVKYASSVFIGTAAVLPLVPLFCPVWKAEAVVLGIAAVYFAAVCLLITLPLRLKEME